MVSHNDDPIHGRDEQREEPLSAVDARQARRGRRVLIVLLAGLAIAMLIWVPAEWWGQSQVPDDSGSINQPSAASTVEPGDAN